MTGVGSLWLDAKVVLPKVQYEVVEQGPSPGSVLKRMIGRLELGQFKDLR